MAPMPRFQNLNHARLEEIVGIRYDRLLDNMHYENGVIRAEFFAPATPTEWASLWQHEEPQPKCACEPEPQPQVGDTFDLTKAEVRLLQELRKQRASDEQLAALPKLHKRAAGYPATPPPGYIKHIVKPIEIDFLNYQEQD